MTRPLGLALALVLITAACGDDEPAPAPTIPPGTGGASSTSSSSATTSSGEGGASTSVGGAGGTGGAADTWDSFAMAFMDSYCVECHTAGDPEGRDYTLYAEIVEEADSIRCGVAPTELPDCTGLPPATQFPVGNGPMPSDAERQRLVDWIDAGLPE